MRGALGRVISVARVSLAALAACALIACSPSAKVAEADYPAMIVGGWQGTVGDTKEDITFNGDGTFAAYVRPTGFISNTLGQGITGTIRGTWTIKGKSVTLTVDSTARENVRNRTTTSTIESFKTDEIVVKSEKGATTTFVRM